MGAGSASASAHGCWGACPLRAGPPCLLCSPPAQAKLGDEVLDYRDLAALPKDKAIYNIDRPDMISYSPYISRVAADRQSYSEVGPVGGAGGRRGAVTPQCRSRHAGPHCSRRLSDPTPLKERPVRSAQTPVSWEVARSMPSVAWKRPRVRQGREPASGQAMGTA